MPQGPPAPQHPMWAVMAVNVDVLGVAAAFDVAVGAAVDAAVAAAPTI